MGVSVVIRKKPSHILEAAEEKQIPPPALSGSG